MVKPKVSSRIDLVPFASFNIYLLLLKSHILHKNMAPFPNNITSLFLAPRILETQKYCKSMFDTFNKYFLHFRKTFLNIKTTLYDDALLFMIGLKRVQVKSPLKSVLRVYLIQDVVLCSII